MNFDYPRNIRFKCVKCGICCGNTRERTRHILLLGEEAEKIALAKNQPISDFASEIENRTPYRFQIKKTAEGGKCVFLKQNRCIIYSKRPLICRFYPFGLTTNEQQKTFYYTKQCPGIGKGETMREDDFDRLLRLANKRNRMNRGKGKAER